MNQLSAKGPTVVMKLTTMHGSSTDQCTLIEGLVIRDMAGRNEVRVDKAYSRSEIPIDKTSVTFQNQRGCRKIRLCRSLRILY